MCPKKRKGKKGRINNLLLHCPKMTTDFLSIWRGMVVALNDKRNFVELIWIFHRQEN